MDRTAHILVVDDDKEIRSLLSKFLAKNGLRVSVAADGREMRRVLDEAKIDLIVLDLMLPGDSGLTLCGQLRATTTIPILMLTAVAEDTDRIIGLEMGADDYLAKPFNPRELLARVRAILRRAEDRPAAPSSSAATASSRLKVWKAETPISDSAMPAARTSANQASMECGTRRRSSMCVSLSRRVWRARTWHRRCG